MAGSGGRDDDEPHEQQLDANSRPVDGGVFGWQRPSQPKTPLLGRLGRIGRTFGSPLVGAAQ